MRYTTGNLLDCDVEALVNTVNTVGVMGKGIALMFKERFPDAFLDYERACEAEEIRIGKVHVFQRKDLYGPKWIISFPTKKHWRHPSKLSWIEEGLADLRRVIIDRGIKSIAIPPLGSGNGKLDWRDVRPLIDRALSDLPGVDIVVFEPTQKYQNVARKEGVEKLTPARALIAELIRRYGVLGVECTLLEVQKLAYVVDAIAKSEGLKNPLKVSFSAHKFGPYADELRHLLNSIDGSYITSDKRINDCGPFDALDFAHLKRDFVNAYFSTEEAKEFRPILDKATEVIEGFETPLGMELLTTVDWLIRYEGAEPTVNGIKAAIDHWPAGKEWAKRKKRIFEDRLIEIALRRVLSGMHPLAA